MANLFLSASDPTTSFPTAEGGPFSEATVRLGDNVVAHYAGDSWVIDDGLAFGDANLTGAHLPVILGQAK